MNTRVVVVGSLNEDVVVETMRHPRPGETLMGSSLQRFAGGKGANQAVAASQAADQTAGGSTVMIGRVGPDPSGKFLVDVLQKALVNASQVGVCKHDPTGTALIVVDEHGENTIVVVPGANAMLRSVHIDDAFGSLAIDAEDVVLLQLEVPPPVVAHALECARKVSARTILNAAPSQPIPHGMLALVSVLIVNEHEVLAISGQTELEAGASFLSNMVETLVITLGGAGVLVINNGARTNIAGYAIQVADTTGAGDAFCGAFARSLAEGSDVQSAARFANAAAALACTKLGAQSGLATRPEINSFISANGER
jgi:ribokinase